MPSKELQPQIESPWLQNPEWRAGAIQTRNKTAMITVTAIATLLSVLSWPTVFLVLPRELEKGNCLALLMLIFPLAGLGVAVMAFRSIRRYMKFGESTFRLAANPGIIGGELSGVIVTTTSLTPENGFKLTLNCVRRRVSGTGKNRRVSERTLWQSMQTIKTTLGSDGANETAIPVQFAIPYECESCTADQTLAERVYWKLEITADQPGVDFHTHFEVPVFRTSDSSPDFQADTSLVEDFVVKPSEQDVYREARLIRQSDGQRLTIRFPFLRDFKSAFSTSLFLLCWVGFTAFLSRYMVSWEAIGLESAFGLIFVSVFGMFALLIFALAFDLWLWRGSIRVDQKGVEIAAGHLKKTGRFVEANRIKSIFQKRTMQVGNLVYHDLILVTSDEEKISIGRRIVNEASARAIIADIESHLAIVKPVENESFPSVAVEGVAAPASVFLSN